MPVVRPSLKFGPPHRVQPKQQVVRQPLIGKCMMCREDFYGNAALRVRCGAMDIEEVGYDEVELKFVQESFPDHSRSKWVCFSCAVENRVPLVSSLDPSVFSDELNGITADGQCYLCDEVMQPMDHEDSETVILLEVGRTVPSTKGNFSILQVSMHGYVHWPCVEDHLGIDLDDLIDRVDSPDPFEYDPYENR